MIVTDLVPIIPVSMRIQIQNPNHTDRRFVEWSLLVHILFDRVTLCEACTMATFTSVRVKNEFRYNEIETEK